jgi:hypothetical protein
LNFLSKLNGFGARPLAFEIHRHISGKSQSTE